LGWLVACLLFICCAASFYFGKVWWWLPAVIAVILSQALVIIYWKDAKWGTVANLIILIGVIVGYAHSNFQVMVTSEVHKMYSSVSKRETAFITGDMPDKLPAPVKRWLTNSGIVGKREVQTLRLKQKGLMRSKPTQKRWSPMKAEQYFVIDGPSFIWKATMDLMPWISITARDKYFDGKGEIKISILSLIPIANSSGHQVDQGTLQRYLAEICWFPSAALSPYIKWDSIDDTSARATLTYKGISGVAIFHFNENGEITSCNADRYMSSGKSVSLEKWEVRSTEYGVMGGIRIPVKSEVTWKLKGGDFTWLKLEITEIDYNKRQLY
jgi:hypothetical protein